MALARRVDGLILGDAHSGPDASPNPLLAELAARRARSCWSAAMPTRIAR